MEILNSAMLQFVDCSAFNIAQENIKDNDDQNCEDPLRVPCEGFLTGLVNIAEPADFQTTPYQYLYQLGQQPADLKKTLPTDPFERKMTINPKQPQICDACGKSFDYKYKLIAHLKITHLKLKPFTCHFCNKGFGKKPYLIKHLNLVHHKLKPFTCEICKKTFGQKICLTSHQNAIHFKIRPFSCQLCGKQFGLRTDLKSHVNCVHIGLKPFVCHECNKSFGVKQSLVSHINHVHNKKPC